MAKTYEDGLNEAWKAARRIFVPVDKGGLSVEEINQIFFNNNPRAPHNVFDNYSALGAIEQLEKYDARNKIVHVGDEIYSELTNSKAVVQRIDAWNRYECFTDNGAQFIIDKHTFNDYWVKTGKNYPQIAEVIKQMQEGEEN